MKKIHMLTLFTTNRCNLDCIYCSTNAGKKLPDELTLDEKKRIIKEAHSMGAKLINLCGSGEPILDDDFYDLVEYIDELGMTPEVVTNGTMIDEKNARWLLEHNAYVVFKLNSFSPKTSDMLVGKKDAYKWVDHQDKKIPYGLKCLIDVGYDKIPRKLFFCAPFQVQCVISKYNYKEIPEIAKFCKKNNIYFFLESLIWDGRASINKNQLELNKDEYKWLKRKIIGKVDIGFLIHQKRVSCVLEHNPVIDAQGNIRICYSRGADIGNIKNNSLMELYNNAQLIRKEQSIPLYKGIRCNFKTCAGRAYFQSINKNEK